MDSLVFNVEKLHVVISGTISAAETSLLGRSVDDTFSRIRDVRRKLTAVAFSFLTPNAHPIINVTSFITMHSRPVQLFVLES